MFWFITLEQGSINMGSAFTDDSGRDIPVNLDEETGFFSKLVKKFRGKIRA